MKKYVLYILMAFCLVSCTSKDNIKKPLKIVKPLTYEQKLKNHYDSLKTFNDSIFLGFILRDSKKSVEAHIKKLIREGKTKNKETYTITVMGNSIIVSGYPYTLYFEGKKMETLFKPFYENNKLFQIEIAMIEGGDSDYVVRAMNKKYGKSKTTKEGYRDSYMWIKNNTQIEVGSGSLFTICYTDFVKNTDLKTMEQKQKKNEYKTGDAQTKDAI